MKAQLRPTSDTPLRRWLDRYGVTAYEFGKAARINLASCSYIIRGKALPDLINALKIEVATNGAVKPADWLKTRLGRARWKWVIHRGKADSP